MDDPLPGSILLFFIFLLLHALFAVAETAVVNLDNNQLKRRIEQGDRRAKRIGKILAHPSRFLSSLRFGALVMDVWCMVLLAPRFADAIGLRLAGDAANAAGWYYPLTLLISLVLLMITQTLADIFTKKVAARMPEGATYFFAGVISLAFHIFLPLVRLMQGIANGLARLFRIKDEDRNRNVTEEEIRMMVDIGQERGSIEEAEGEMIDNIFDFNNKTAEEIMTHRKDIVAICIEDSEDKVAEIVSETGHSRYPVYREDIDDIVGILHIRDYYMNLHAKQRKPLPELVRRAHFVPENVRTDVLFRDLQKRSVHLAIVVDEYGGTSGVITVEDLLEEIVGNIYDEYDNEMPDYEQIDEDCYRLRGSMDLEDIEDLFGVTIDTEDFDTLGGLIFSQLSQIPEDGSRPELDAYGLHIRVEEIVDRRVESAVVCRDKITVEQEIGSAS